MAESNTTWTNADFERLSWHDNHVHGLRIVEGEHGSGELVLDIDHIVEWLPPVEGSCRFLLAPATLTFHEVYDLRIEIDYTAPATQVLRAPPIVTGEQSLAPSQRA